MPCTQRAAMRHSTVRGQRAADRRDREEHDADAEHQPPSVQIAQRTAGQNQRGEEERVALDDPLRLSGRRVQLALQPGSETLTAVLSMKRIAEPRIAATSTHPVFIIAPLSFRTAASTIDRLTGSGPSIGRCARRFSPPPAMRSCVAPSRATGCVWGPGASSRGETAAEFLPVARDANARGFAVAATILGESVRDRAETLAVTDEYCELLRAFAAERIDANVAFKLTHVGLDIDPELAFDNASRIVAAAAEGHEHGSHGYGAVALRRSHARDLPPPARALRQRRLRAAVVSLP